jgi:hypothetical protein
MKNRSGSWLYLRVSVAALLAGLFVGVIAESPATATTPPTTSILVPANGAKLSGTTTLDASASNATSVEFWIAGGSYGYGKVIGTATPTYYGWVYSWNTTTVPNASYALLSEAFGAGGSAFSSPISITVNNANASWPQNGYGPDRTEFQPNETKIGTANVGTLALVRTYEASDGGASSPLIANGTLYEVIMGTLYAFDATGSTCSPAPTTCTPLWSAPAANFDGMTIANGVVFVTGFSGGVQAFDAAGSTNCSETPKVCKPLWQTSTNTGTGPAFTPGPGSPVVANGVLYVPGAGNGGTASLGGAYVAAFDTAGSKGCTVYSVFGDICVPMWTTSVSATPNSGSPTIAGGVLYIANGPLYAFDAAGSTDCTTGTPKVCSPLWTGTTSSSATSAAPSVANGTVYVASRDAKLYTFDAAGSTDCTTGTPKVCSPLWTATTPFSIDGTPAVANGTVYTLSADGTLSAFDATGSMKCSGAALSRTCMPLWTAAAGVTGSETDAQTAIAIANGVVYVAPTSGALYGFDAAGSINCSVTGGTTACKPLWSAASGSYAGTAVVANGVVYANGPGAVWAYSL